MARKPIILTLRPNGTVVTRKPKPSGAIIAAIHPNAGVTAWYYARLDEVLSEAYIDAALQLTLAYRDRPKVGIAAIDSVRWEEPYVIALACDQYGQTTESRVEPGYWRIAMDADYSVKYIDDVLKRWGKKWNKRFDKMADDIAKRFTARAFRMTDVAMKAAFKQSGFTVSFKATRRSLQAYKLTVADNVGLIKNLQQDFYNRIQQDVWASVRAGADMATLSSKLTSSYGITKKRAARISVDQNAKAKAVIETTRRQELGITQAIWQHSSAGKTKRPVHVKWGKDQQVFDLAKGLYDPEEGEFVFPGQLINCKCTSRAVIKGFERT